MEPHLVATSLAGVGTTDRKSGYGGKGRRTGGADSKGGVVIVVGGEGD